jgi:uncharacterized protein YbjT (DUF2867 family)
MRVLLTGANGFIGSHITAALLASGHEVTAAIRNPAKMLQRFPQIRAVAADMNLLLTPENWKPHLNNIDVVINCAGILQSSGSQQAVSIHDASPRALFEAAEHAGIVKIVQVSAISISAETEYAQTKQAADDALRQSSLPWVILRPSLVYARTAYGGTTMLRALAAAPIMVPVVGTGNQLVTPIHAFDLAKAVLLAVETNTLDNKIIHPCGPETMTLGQMQLKYRMWLGLPEASILYVPRWLVALCAKIGDVIGDGPLCTTALLQIEQGNDAVPQTYASQTGLNPRAFNDFLAHEPAGTAELWHARSYLLRPIVTFALMALWLVSGISGLLADVKSIEAASPHLPLAFGFWAGKLTSIFDLVIAYLLLWGGNYRVTFHLQWVAVLAYTVLFTVLAPGLWLELLGPLLKNIPILALICVWRILAEER